jgi:hypothetical protein
MWNEVIYVIEILQCINHLLYASIIQACMSGEEKTLSLHLRYGCAAAGEFLLFM